MLANYRKDHFIYGNGYDGMDAEDGTTLLNAQREHLKNYPRAAWHREMEHVQKELKIDNHKFGFTVLEKTQLEKMAWVGAKNWHGQFTPFPAPFTSPQIKYSEPEEAGPAKNWPMATNN